MNQSVHHQLLDAIRAYHVPPAAAELLKKHQPLMIAGITASGKNSVAAYLSQISDFRHVITHTTRQPRAGERSGQNYWFVDEPEMARLLRGQTMIEANVVHGNVVYGTSIDAYRTVIEAGHEPLLIIDVQGVEDITKSVPDLRAVFLLPPSFEAWMERLDKRGRMSHIERVRRLKSARSEMEQALRSKHFNLFVNREVNSVAKAIINKVVFPSEQYHNRELALRLIEHAQSY